MKALSMVLVFGGYMLIYAAVAQQGKFATEPWAGLFADAYADNTIGPGATSPIVPGSSSSTTTPGTPGTPTPTPPATPRGRIRPVTSNVFLPL